MINLLSNSSCFTHYLKSVNKPIIDTILFLLILTLQINLIFTISLYNIAFLQLHNLHIFTTIKLQRQK